MQVSHGVAGDRALRSFPTRRSSDLDIVWGTKLAPDMIKVVKFPKDSIPEGHFESTDAVKGRITVSNLKKIGRATSELQSHSDLVCRLLLEKKRCRGPAV